MKLWLDDERPAPDGWQWVKTADEAIYALRDNLITHMSFDHDLADVHYAYWHVGHNPGFPLDKDHPVRVAAREESAKEMTGYDVLLWMAEHEVWPTEACYVHTHNSVRGPVMADMINRYGPYEHKTIWTPYVP